MSNKLKLYGVIQGGVTPTPRGDLIRLNDLIGRLDQDLEDDNDALDKARDLLEELFLMKANQDTAKNYYD